MLGIYTDKRDDRMHGSDGLESDLVVECNELMYWTTSRDGFIRFEDRYKICVITENFEDTCNLSVEPGHNTRGSGAFRRDSQENGGLR